MSDPKHDDQHETVWLLLPWLANGTLETDERRLAEDHLAGCASCREELTRCNGLAAALRGRQEVAPSPHPLQLARLMERVEASERGSDVTSAGEIGEAGEAGELSEAGEARATAFAGMATPSGRMDGRAGSRRRGRARGPSLLGDTPRPVRWALAGQLAALVLLAAALAFGPARRFQSAKPASPAPERSASPAPERSASPAPERPAVPAGALYTTLSAPSGPAAAWPAVAPQIRIRFAETATEKQMRDVLLSTRGRLVDGPSPLGAYTLELPVPASSPAAPPAGGSRSTGGETAPAPPPAPRGSLAEAAPDSVGVVLSYLRSQRIVRFAEPVAGTGTTALSPASPAAPAGGTGAAASPGSPAAPPP
jgi:hypothetical protein